ncbi:MAG: (d)CMP kinase [Deltaproteobacteria bacterium]|nr:MAG: (d)CMP kinase [Deltaproteobacteria bacterium]
MEKQLIIAIDGPSGSGKSTLAKLLSERLGHLYIDTGAMYRTAALGARRAGVDIDDVQVFAKFCSELDISFTIEEGKVKILLRGEDVSGEIRDPEMGILASAISAKPLLREKLVELQRRIGEKGGVVLEGRDIGTVVFPQADLKFYLDASLTERAQRRCNELRQNGKEIELKEVLEEIKERDLKDSTRDFAPLKKADEAVVIDSTNKGIQEVLEEMLGYIIDCKFEI